MDRVALQELVNGSHPQLATYRVWGQQDLVPLADL